MSTHRYNPYIAGNPLRREQDFLGREQVLARVASALRIPSVNSLVLFGQRRIGKTSILYHLERTLPRDQFAPVYFDLQAFARRPVGELLAELAAVIADRTDFEEPSAENFDDRGRYFTQIFLPQLYQHLPAGVRPVFLLDEFDVLDSLSAQDLPRTSAAVAFFPFLSRLMQEDPRPIFVFVFGRHQDDLAIDFTATFKASLTQEIWTLEPSEAEQLVRQAEGNDSLRFTAEAVAAILETTNCHPYLTQLLCQRIWERAYRTQLERAPEITAAHVREAIPDALEAGSQALVWLWDGLSAAEKIYAAALAEITAPGQTISEAEIVNTLTANATRLRTREVEQAPTDLVKRRILTQTAEQVYTFTIPLFHEWVSQRKTLREVKDELDRQDPLAEQYYNLGHQEFASGQWEAALDNFDKALQRNGQHFRARLERAEALLELGQLNEGLDELRRAYAQDKRETRYPLVRGLRRWAEQVTQTGEGAAVMAIYEEILTISPNESFAREFLGQVWQGRGDKAAEAKEYAEAITAYEAMTRYAPTEGHKQAANEKLTAVRTEQSIQERLQKAQADQTQASWLEVRQLYEQLLSEFPHDSRRVTWQAQADLAAEEAELIQLFELAQHHLEKREWEAARVVLANLTTHRAGYSAKGQAVSQLSLWAKGEEKAQIAHKAGDWPTSADNYDQLLKDFAEHPRRQRWQEKRQEAQDKLALEKSLREGMTAVQAQDWKLAKSKLAEALALPVGYAVQGWTADYLGRRIELGEKLEELEDEWQWGEAIQLCQAFNPPDISADEQSWVAQQIAHYQLQGELTELFAAARDKIAQAKWPEAKGLLVQVVKKEPLFKQHGKYAAELMLEAAKKGNAPVAKAPPADNSWWMTGLGCLVWLVILYVASIGVRKFYDSYLAPEPTAVAVAEATSEGTSTPNSIIRITATLSMTPIPSATPIFTPTPFTTPTLTPAPNIPPANAQLGDQWVRLKDGMVMVFVPPPNRPFNLSNGLEAPTEGFWIDKYEVTNAQYQLCVDDRVCEPSAYADDPNFNEKNYPVVGVSWHDAIAYATWAGAELPTEEQWEYATVGEEGFIYPWGNEFDEMRLNCNATSCPNDGYQYTAPVGSYLTGASWVGARDMAGNVREWTQSP